MQTWRSFHFQALETPDLFLARAFRPFLEQYIWPQAGARAFFIRYEDEQGPHLRLRLRAEETYMQESLRPAFEAWMTERGSWTEAAYDPETERYGGPEGLALAEEYFHQSTRVVLDRLNRPYTYGDAMFDTLRLHTITAFAAGMTRPEAGKYFSRLADQWLPLFFHSEEKGWQDQVKADFENAYARQQETLQGTLQALWQSLEQEKLDKNQPEWLRWLRANQMILAQFGPSLEKVLPSLLHLTGNRIGLNNQDEVYILYILSRAL